MSEKNIKKIGIRDALGEYIYTDIGVDADKVDIDSSTNLAEKLVEIDNKFEDLEAGGYANKNIYGDEKINLGRKVGTAAGPYSVTIGRDVSATGTCSLAEGKDTAAEGNYSHAEGQKTTASGHASHAEGQETTASGSFSHAEGHSTTASRYYSHAEGQETTASGDCSHAEGHSTTASGNHSHAEGNSTKAEGLYSHAEGLDTTASGYASHAEGTGTIARGVAQHVQGKFNVEDIEGRYAHIVGGGANGVDRKNIHTLDWQGNAEYAGDVVAHDEGGNEISLRKINKATYYGIVPVTITSSTEGMFGQTAAMDFFFNLQDIKTALSEKGITASEDITGVFVMGIETNDGSLTQPVYMQPIDLNFGAIWYWVKKAPNMQSASELQQDVKLCAGKSDAGSGIYNLVLTIGVVGNMNLFFDL